VKDVRVGPLDKSHLDAICDNWTYYHPRFRPVILHMLEFNQTVGVFARNEEGQEELASMVLQSEYGGIGLLQTLPKFQRRGFASVALAHLTKNLGLNGVNPFSLHVLQNQTSSLLFEKLGYKKCGIYSWVKLVKT